MKISQPLQATLFHTQWWSSSRPAAILMELGLTKEQGGPIDIVTITEKELKNDPWLVENNPQKRLPFFYDPTKDHLKLNESGGMVQYLLETYDTKNKLWPAINGPTRAEFLKLVHFGPATAYHVAAPIFSRSALSADSPKRASEQEYKAKQKEWHAFVAPTLEQALEKYGGPYLLGDTFSAADCVLGYDLMTISFTDCSKELMEPYPKLQKYFETIRQRQVYKTLYSMPETTPSKKNKAPDTTSPASNKKAKMEAPPAGTAQTASS